MPRRPGPRCCGGAAGAFASAAASTSCLRMRPPTPVPLRLPRSIPFSAANFRTSGVTYGLSPLGSAPAAGSGCAAGAGLGLWFRFGLGLGLRDGLRAWFRLGLRLGLGLGLRFGRACGAAPASPMRPNSPPTGTVTSSSAVMLSSVPATGEGISVSTLSVETSTRGSSISMVSPTFFSQRVTVPSVTDSPSSGIFTGVEEPDDCAAGFGSGSGSGPGSGCSTSSAAGSGSAGLLLLGRGRRAVRRGLRGLARLADERQLAADLDGVVLLRDDLGQHTRRRGGDLGVDLVRRHLEQRLVDLDGVALLLQPPCDGALGHAPPSAGIWTDTAMCDDSLERSVVRVDLWHTTASCPHPVTTRALTCTQGEVRFSGTIDGKGPQ